MSPQEALALIDHVCSQVQVNRQGHAQLTTAINVLSQLVSVVTPPNQVVDEPQAE